MELLGELSLLGDIAFHTKCKDNILCIIFIQCLLFATCISHQHTGEHRRLHLNRTVANSIGNFCLQLLGKIIIAFAGNDYQFVYFKHTSVQHGLVLPLALAVYTQTHTTTHFLPLLCLVVAVLQSTYLEHIRIVPTFFQG